MEILKAIHGMLEASLCWHGQFRSDSEGYGFVFNNCDPCAANKVVKGKQQTVQFHVDDLMLSHVDKKVNDKFLKWLNCKYGTHAEVTSTRGEEHKYSGMKFIFRDNEFTINITGKVKEILEEFPIEFKDNESQKVTSPASPDMFEVVNSEYLDTEKRELFHCVVAQNLFMSKRGKQDTQPTIAVLCAQVQKPKEKDWSQLVRHVKWLYETKDDVMTFDASKGLNNFEWCVDASFAVHPDFRTHTCGSRRFSGGRGCPINASTKQKSNTDSCTTVELVAVGQFLPLVMWVPLLLGEQGYPTETNRAYQDNKSAILLEKNRKASSSKRTRAINVGYFMVTDLVKRGELDIICCPTDEMIGDYFTKSLKGTSSVHSRRLLRVSESSTAKNLSTEGVCWTILFFGN